MWNRIRSYVDVPSLLDELWLFFLQSVFDELDGEEMRRARTRSNAYEMIRGVFFLNRLVEVLWFSAFEVSKGQALNKCPSPVKVSLTGVLHLQSCNEDGKHRLCLRLHVYKSKGFPWGKGFFVSVNQKRWVEEHKRSLLKYELLFKVAQQWAPNSWLGWWAAWIASLLL